MVHRLARGGYNFYNPIRCAFATDIIQFVLITNYRNVRLKVNGVVFIQEYRKGRRIYLALAIVGLNMVVNRVVDIV